MYILDKKIGIVILAIIISGIIYISFFSNESTRYDTTLTLSVQPYIPSNNTELSEYIEYYTQPLIPSTIIVFISGEVNYPDVFELSQGSRIIDVLNLAGGPTPYADLNRINLASEISDEQHIIIPTVGQEIATEYYSIGYTATTVMDPDLININTASLGMLTTLPGIGPVIGQNIINYREQNGPFSSIEQIQNVTRIGPTIFGNIQNMITVD